MKKITENQRNLFPVFLVFYEISNYLANDAYLPALPDITQQLKTSNDLMQLTLTVFFLGNASMQLILGPICDRYGRRPLLLGGGMVFIATTFLCALTSNMHVLIIARFFQGSSIIAMIVAGYATVHDMYEQVRAIKTLAWMNSITVLAPTLGPIFGALILYFGSWRWIFIILAIWASLGLIALFQFMPETCEKPVPIEFKKIIFQYWQVVCNGQFLKPMLALSILFVVMIAWITAGPFLVMNTFHYSALAFGLVQGLIFGSFVLGTHFVGHFIEKITTNRITQITIATAIGGGLLSLILNLLMPNHLIDIVLPLMIFSFGAGIGFPVFNRLAIEAGQQPMGIKMALFASFLGISGLLGSLIASSAYLATVMGFSLFLLIFSFVFLPLSGRHAG